MNGPASIAGAAALAFLMAEMVWLGTPRESPVPVSRMASRELALAVKRQGRALDVSWDRNMEAVRNCTHAMLQIFDGSHHTQLELNAAEVNAGKLVYWPETEDVSLTLKVDGATQASARTMPVSGVAPIPAAAASEDRAQPKPSPFEPPRRRLREQPVSVSVPETAGIAPENEPAPKARSLFGRLAHKIPLVRRFQKSRQRPNGSSD